MKIQVEEGISNWLLFSVVGLCASPAITLNVWPRIEQMTSTGGWTSNQVGIVLLVALSALGMTLVPFAMKKAENLGFWSICLAFGIGLGILNYTMAVGAVGKARDSESDSKKQIIEKASSLRRSIAENEEARRTLPPFKWTSQEMVASASQAVTFAREAQEAECKIVKDICRARIAQLSSRQSELADISSNRASTERAEQLDSSIRRIRENLSSLGTIPAFDDPQATRIALAIGTIFSLGANAADTVATGLIHFLAICAEAFALGMPRIIVTALAKQVEKKDEKPPAPLPTPPLAKRPLVPKPPIQRREVPSKTLQAPVPEWKESFLIRATGKIRAWDAYTHYRDWAKDVSKHLPTTFPVFNSELERLGIRSELDTITQRDFYLDVAIKTPLKAVS